MVKNEGLKKTSLYVHFKGLTTDSYLAKQNPLGGGWIEKRLFQPSSDEKTWFLTCPVVFKWSKMGVKKTSLYDHFEGLTTDSYLAKQDPLGGGQIEKKGFFNPLLMRKHDFWHVQWFLNGQKWGVKKSISVCPFWRFDNWLLFGKTRHPGGRLDRKEGFFNPLLMRRHDFWHVQWFLNGQKWGLKKHLCMTILKVWQLTLIWQNKTPWGEVR